jgi:S1-C subfamily serine protease
MTTADLARGARTPPALRLSSVAIALTEGAPGAQTRLAGIAPAASPLEPARIDIDPEPWPGDPPPDDSPSGEDPGEVLAADPHAASVVAIRAGGAAGHGFYVRDDLVLTTHRLVGTTSVADVTTPDGATVLALVAAVDAARDLALLQVPRPGSAVALFEGAAPPLALPAGAGDAGLPVLWSDQVVGMTTGGSGRAMVPAAAIQAFLDSQAGLLAALP